MAKFKFGAPPKTFKRNIKFDTLEGVKEDFDVVFNFRSRKEAGVLFDEMLSAAKARGAGKDKDDMTMTEIMEATTGNNSKYLIKALASWEFEQELNDVNAERLANEWPGAAGAIMEAYRTACLEGRLGN